MYSSFDDELVQERAQARKLLHQFNTQEDRVSLQSLIPNAPKDLIITPPFHCDYGYNIFCGSNVYFNFNCTILDVAKVTIGSNVLFGPGVQLYTATHPLDHVLRKTSENGKPISIGDDSWIGGGAIIMAGVTIGERCVIGAGSVVTKDIPNDSLAVGNPAKVIRKISSNDK